MNEPKVTPSTFPETVPATGGMPASEPVNHVNPATSEQTDTITFASTENHIGTTELPDKSDEPPAYSSEKQQQTAPITNPDPYPGYNPQPYKIVPVPLQQLGDAPAHVECPWCHTLTLTNVTKTNSSQTIVTSVLCCLFCGIICVLLPTALGWFQNVEHRCGNPNCRKRIAYKPNDGLMQIETGIPPETQVGQARHDMPGYED